MGLSVSPTVGSGEIGFPVARRNEQPATAILTVVSGPIFPKRTEPIHSLKYRAVAFLRGAKRETAANNYLFSLNDPDRIDLAVRQIVGKRITFAELTGKVGEMIN